MKAYSEDLRQRIVQAVEDGSSQPIVAERYTVSLNSVKRYVKQWRATASLAPQPRPGRPRAIPPAVHPALIAQFDADPDATFATYCDQGEGVTGVRVSESTMYRAQQRIGWTRRKASDRERAGWSGAGRLSGDARVMGRDATDLDRRERDTDEHDIALQPGTAWGAGSGQRTTQSRAEDDAGGFHVVAGLGAAMTREGALDGDAFVAGRPLGSMEAFLVPTLVPGAIVVMDNLSVHKDKRVRPLIEGAGCRLIYLPAYSPDLTPIEQAFSKIKEYLRRAGARRRAALEEAITAAMATVTAQDANGWFAHCGYAT